MDEHALNGLSDGDTDLMEGSEAWRAVRSSLVSSMEAFGGEGGRGAVARLLSTGT
jgi:hypothetical protein